MEPDTVKGITAFRKSTCYARGGLYEPLLNRSETVTKIGWNKLEVTSPRQTSKAASTSLSTVVSDMKSFTSLLFAALVLAPSVAQIPHDEKVRSVKSAMRHRCQFILEKNSSFIRYK